MQIMSKNDTSIQYTDEMCMKISKAIKRSGIFDDINPADLVKNKLENFSNENDYIPTQKKTKSSNETNILEQSQLSSTNVPENSNINLKFKVSNTQDDISQNSNVVDLPQPDVIFLKPNNPVIHKQSVTPQINKSSVTNRNNDMGIHKKSILPSPNALFANESHNVTNKNNEMGIHKKSILPTPDALFANESQDMDDVDSSCDVIDAFEGNSFITSTPENKSSHNMAIKSSQNKEKQRQSLSNLASTFLPNPNQIFAKNNLLEAVNSKNNSQLISVLRNMSNIEEEVSEFNLSQLIQQITDNRMLSVLPELCNKLKNKSIYSECLANSFVKHNILLTKYKNEFLSTLESMIDSDYIISLASYVKACVAANEWNKMLKIIFNFENNYKFEDDDFKALMDIFQNYSTRPCYFTHDTISIIISYLSRNYPMQYQKFVGDIWIYCIFHEINFSYIDDKTNKKMLEGVLKNVIESLNKNKMTVFTMATKLLTNNTYLINNNIYSDWISKVIADKNDVRKCLTTINEILNNPTLKGHFYILCIKVMSVLNKKSLFTYSKSIFDNFLKTNMVSIKSILMDKSEKFKLKWSMIECLISSNDYKYALNLLKDLDVLKDLEITSSDYQRAKEMLPNLVWHLVQTTPLLPVITLFEQIISIFIFNEKNESSYIKNCNEIFDLIVVRAYELKDKEVVSKMLGLLESIVASDIDFNISTDTLRFLLNSVVNTNIEFDELTDFLEICNKNDILYGIKSSDNLSTSVDVLSNLSTNEIAVLIAWICRKIKIKLVDLAQTPDNTIADSLTKVCSVTFNLQSSKNPEFFCGERHTFLEFFNKFTGALSNPKYLSASIKFNVTKKTNQNATIVCDSRALYNAIYYSNI